MRLILLAIILLLQISDATAEKREIKIGGLFDLTGLGKIWGEAERNAASLALEEFNQANQDLTANLVVEDSAYSNTRSVTALKKLTSVNNIRYIIGPTWEVFVATAPICEQNKIVCLSPSSNNRYFDQNLNYVFSGFYDERDYAAVHLDYLNGLSGNTAIIAGISPYYEAMVDTLVAGLKVPPKTVIRVISEEQDFRQLINRIPKNLDALVVFLLGDGIAPNFFKQWVNLRQDRPVIITDDNADYMSPPVDFKQLGFALRYSIPKVDQGPASGGFLSRYRTKYGEEPGSPSAAIAYDLVGILLNCAKAHDPDTLAVSKCIAATINHPGASGILSFDGGSRIKNRKMQVIVR